MGQRVFNQSPTLESNNTSSKEAKAPHSITDLALSLEILFFNCEVGTINGICSDELDVRCELKNCLLDFAKEWTAHNAHFAK